VVWAARKHKLSAVGIEEWQERCLAAVEHALRAPPKY
jgi:hypothetical protein